MSTGLKSLAPQAFFESVGRSSLKTRLSGLTVLVLACLGAVLMTETPASWVGWMAATALFSFGIAVIYWIAYLFLRRRLRNAHLRFLLDARQLVQRSSALHRVWFLSWQISQLALVAALGALFLMFGGTVPLVAGLLAIVLVWWLTSLIGLGMHGREPRAAIAAGLARPDSVRPLLDALRPLRWESRLAAAQKAGLVQSLPRGRTTLAAEIWAGWHGDVKRCCDVTQRPGENTRREVRSRLRALGVCAAGLLPFALACMLVSHIWHPTDLWRPKSPFALITTLGGAASEALTGREEGAGDQEEPELAAIEPLGGTDERTELASPPSDTDEQQGPGGNSKDWSDNNTESGAGRSAADSVKNGQESQTGAREGDGAEYGQDDRASSENQAADGQVGEQSGGGANTHETNTADGEGGGSDEQSPSSDLNAPPPEVENSTDGAGANPDSNNRSAQGAQDSATPTAGEGTDGRPSTDGPSRGSSDGGDQGDAGNSGDGDGQQTSPAERGQTGGTRSGSGPGNGEEADGPTEPAAGQADSVEDSAGSNGETGDGAGRGSGQQQANSGEGPTAAEAGQDTTQGSPSDAEQSAAGGTGQGLEDGAVSSTGDQPDHGSPVDDTELVIEQDSGAENGDTVTYAQPSEMEGQSISLTAPQDMLNAIVPVGESIEIGAGFDVFASPGQAPPLLESAPADLETSGTDIEVIHKPSQRLPYWIREIIE